MKRIIPLTAACVALMAHAAFAGPTHLYRAHGVTFRYPAAMTASTEMNSGVATIIIKGAAMDPTTLTVQVCPPVMTPAQASQLFVQGVKIGMGSSAHLGTAASASQQIAGSVRQGKKYPLTVQGLNFAMVLYSFPLNHYVLNVAEIRPDATASARASGEADFATVAGSLRARP